jgi:hypothetical protein
MNYGKTSSGNDWQSWKINIVYEDHSKTDSYMPIMGGAADIYNRSASSIHFHNK